MGGCIFGHSTGCVGMLVGCIVVGGKFWLYGLTCDRLITVRLVVLKYGARVS